VVEIDLVQKCYVAGCLLVIKATKLENAPFTRVNTEAIANMSKVVKDFMINAREKFYETNRDIMWLKVTIAGNSHNVQMTMRLPIKTDNQQFTLYKFVVMPIANIKR
jgi:hypothetical protein